MYQEKSEQYGQDAVMHCPTELSYGNVKDMVKPQGQPGGEAYQPKG